MDGPVVSNDVQKGGLKWYTVHVTLLSLFVQAQTQEMKQQHKYHPKLEVQQTTHEQTTQEQSTRKPVAPPAVTHPGVDEVNEDMMKKILGNLYKDKDYLERFLGENGKHNSCFNVQLNKDL